MKQGNQLKIWTRKSATWIGNLVRKLRFLENQIEMLEMKCLTNQIEKKNIVESISSKQD
jgi:hypothetical protein